MKNREINNTSATGDPFDYPRSIGGLGAKESRWRQEDVRLETRDWRVNGEVRTTWSLVKVCEGEKRIIFSLLSD